jgi:hypothetical protein
MYSAAIISYGTHLLYHSFTAYLLMLWVFLIATKIVLMERSVVLGAKSDPSPMVLRCQRTAICTEHSIFPRPQPDGRRAPFLPLRHRALVALWVTSHVDRNVLNRKSESVRPCVDSDYHPRYACSAYSCVFYINIVLDDQHCGPRYSRDIGSSVSCGYT